MKVAVYVSPTIYNDTGLAIAIDKYGKAVNQELGWSVHKEKLDEYKDWKKVRVRVMSDDYPVCIFVGDLNYPLHGELIPFTSDVEPRLKNGGVIIDTFRYNVDRAVTMVYGPVDQIRDAFLKFSNREVGGYKRVRFFGGIRFLGSSDPIPLEYDSKVFADGQESDWEEALSGNLSLLSLQGHGCEYSINVSANFTAYPRTVKNKHIRILLASACKTTRRYPFPRKWEVNGSTTQLPDVWTDMVVQNPYLHLVFTGGYGDTPSEFDKAVIGGLLRGGTYAEVAMNKKIDMFYSMYGDPTFHLRPGSQEAPPSVSPPVTPPPLKKTYIEFRSSPQGAEIWIKKH